MLKESKNFLYKLLETPSPTGFEANLQKVVSDRMKSHCDTIERDSFGNLICTVNPNGSRTIMLAGHADQIGFMVSHITKEGYLHVVSLGGIDPGVVPGSTVRIRAQKGDLRGIFGRKPIHLQDAEDRKRMPLELKKMWIDIGAKDQKDAEKYVEIGDYAVYEPKIIELKNDLITAPGLDNRIGVFVVMEALKLVSKENPSCRVVAVSTAQEEVGLRGATTSSYTVNPDVSIAVDVTFATDNPGVDDSKGPEVKLGEGPCVSRGPNTNEKLRDLILSVAKTKKISVQKTVDGRPFGNDANTMQINRGGSAATAISVPNRYMHTQVEVVSLADLENTAKLLASVCLQINTKTSFIPS